MPMAAAIFTRGAAMTGKTILATTLIMAASICLALAQPAPAHGVNPKEPDPAVWVRSIYDLYKRAEKDDKLMRHANYGLVQKRAARPLWLLFRKDDACMKKNGGAPCAFDADFIINGQDYELSDVQISPAEISGEKAKVTAKFKNFKQDNTNTFFFVKQGDNWRVSEVTMQTGKEKPSKLTDMFKNSR
ncbi:MAG: hypothetical protein ACRCUX_03070 [Beijerinckiaceae bacterium]